MSAVSSVPICAGVTPEIAALVNASKSSVFNALNPFVALIDAICELVNPDTANDVNAAKSVLSKPTSCAVVNDVNCVLLSPETADDVNARTSALSNPASCAVVNADNCVLSNVDIVAEFRFAISVPSA